jgi:hypothetical protein
MPFDGYGDLADKYGFIPANHSAPQFFPVKARRMFDETGNELPGYFRIVREDTGDTLHVATESYKLITNEEAFGAFESALESSSLDLTDMRIGTDYANKGARVFRNYILPAHRVEVKPGVEVALSLVMQNSYDGSMRFRGQVGGYTFVCANTSVSGRDLASFGIRHAGTVDVPTAIKGLTSAAEQHLETVKRWRAWPKIAITDQTAMDTLKLLPQSTETLTDHLVHAWLRARDDGGPQSGANLWTLGAVLTAWGSHAETGGAGGKGQTRFDRQKRVAALLEGKAWAELEAA